MSNRSNKVYIFISVIIIIVGIFLLTFTSIKILKYSNENKKYNKTTTAKIIDTISKSEIKKDKLTGITSNYFVYAPIIEYKIKNKTYRYETTSYDVIQPKVGDTIKIKYNSNNLRKIIIIKEDNNINYLILGIVIFIIGVILLIISTKHNKKIRKINQDDHFQEYKEEKINNYIENKENFQQTNNKSKELKEEEIKKLKDDIKNYIH